MKKEDSNKLKTQNLQNISDEIALSLFLESIMATKQTTYKELPEDISEKLKNLPDELLVPLLFNFILGPAQEMKDTIDKSDETIKDAVVAVYGATVMPLKKRMAALKKISVHVNLDNGVILSGGRSWTSIVPKSYRDQIISNYEINEDYRREIDYKIIRKLYRGEVVTYDETTQEIIEEQIPKELIDRAIDSVTKKIVRGEEVTYDETTQEIVNKVFKEVINDEVRKKINEAMKFDNKKKQIMRDRAKAIIEKVPKIRDFLHDRNKSLWEDLVAEEKKKIFEKGVNESSSESLLKFSTYDQMYKNYIEQKINEIINSNVSRQEYYKIYEEQKISGQEFDKWLYDYLDNQYIIDQIIHTLTEVDIMKIELEGLEWEEKSKVKKDELRIIEDKKATHTRDNAENIIIEFLK